ncbi:MAG TPA: RtcB family protein [Armatimonadota bacterium]|nr:RtcB family protein [Armatimonadota bacterium]
MANEWRGPLEKAGLDRWRIPKGYKPGMRTDGLIYANEQLLKKIREDQAPEQVANVAFLPGIQGKSMAMPDIHWGYGFPIGGVAAMSYEEGVVSPGGVGYDINCGVRMLRTDLERKDVVPRMRELVDALFTDIPCGVGSEGRIRLNEQELRDVLRKGGKWAVEQGYGWAEDIEVTEERGQLDLADPSAASERAMKRGRPQIGTLGSGNHFIEIQYVDEIYEPEVAQVFGVDHPGQITVMIHSGSRGFGYQICDDYLVVMQDAMRKYHIDVPDRQLACAPITSPEGQKYLTAMACAANYAWANRQAMAHWTREVFSRVFGAGPHKLGMRQIYDVAHNIAKIETHEIGDQKKKVVVHRKGATRAFPAGHPDVPAIYRAVGQPVLIPGDMGRYSYLLVGTDQAMKETFGSTCHGAGRVMSRKAAMRESRGADVQQELADKGILVKAASRGTLAEEAPEAYKDVSLVVETAHDTGISRKVARLKPLGVIKG